MPHREPSRRPLSPEQKAFLDYAWLLAPKETINARDIEVVHLPTHDVWIHHPRGQAPAKPQSADGFDHGWPLGLTANLRERKVRRNGVEADLSANRPAWKVLDVLADGFPRKFSRDELMSAVWRKTEPEHNALHSAVKRLRKLIQPLGLTVPHASRSGYTLSPLF
jgi:DNA-binding response OmpR family regulator